MAAKPSATSLKLTTTGITLKRGGAETKTCNFSPSSISGGFSSGSNQAWLMNGSFGETWIKCSEGNYLKMQWITQALYDNVSGVYYMNLVDNTGIETSPTPWGGLFKQETGNTAKGVWTNGSGATQSKLTFTESTIGYVGGKAVTMTATFTATTSSGTLITFSH